jgi:hypothetical protein
MVLAIAAYSYAIDIIMSLFRFVSTHPNLLKILMGSYRLEIFVNVAVLIVGCTNDDLIVWQ